MEAVVAYGHRLIAASSLPRRLETVCTTALEKRGRLFSASPTCGQISLGWIEALTAHDHDRFYPGVVAGDCTLAGYDLLDSIYDRQDQEYARTDSLPGGVTLLNLAQECLRRAPVPAERQITAAAALAHGGRRAATGHLSDYLLRGAAPSDAGTLLRIARQRSGSLVAASASASAILAGGSWRQVGLASCFGRAFGLAAQLEDDYADRAADAASGRQTIATLLAAGTGEQTVHATTWVLIRRSLRTAAGALARLEKEGIPGSTARLWSLLPTALQSAYRAGHTCDAAVAEIAEAQPAAQR